MSSTSDNIGLYLGNFFRDGDESSWIKKLKKLGLIVYSPGKPNYTLTDTGRAKALELGIMPPVGMPEGHAARTVMGIDPASPEGDEATVVVLEKKDGKLRVLGSGKLPKAERAEAVKADFEAGHVVLSGDDIDGVDEATGAAFKGADAYLLWVGAEHYPTIEDFVKEAAELGVSKRMSNPAVCKRVVESGLPVLLAHDEGRRKVCPACETKVPCPTCRKTIELIAKLRREAQELQGDTKLDDLKPGRRKQVELRIRKADDLADKCCPQCNDDGVIKSGSGGTVVFQNDVTWDYRQYNYWLHQPKKIQECGLEGLPKDIKTLDRFVKEDHMCAECGGRGELPEGVVFGLFFPTAMEFISAGMKYVDEKAAKDGFHVVRGPALAREPKRGCGTRKAGGVYVVAHEVRAGKLDVAAALKAAGAELRGPLIQFVEPVSVEFKRCRGVKLIATDGALKSEVKMIKEALE